MYDLMTQPRAAWWRDGDEWVIQNMVGAYLGQEHRHDRTGFLAWCESAEADGWDITPANWRDED